MKSKSVWPLLRAGKAEREQGLELCREAYARNPDGSHTMQLGIALLWVKQYASAWEHFQAAIEKHPNKAFDSEFGMAGVARWCLGERREAVAAWVLGLKAKYAGSAGLGLSMPLLLFFASVITPEMYDIATSRKLMLEKSKDIRIKSWPGPIVQRILGQINDGEFLRHCQGRDERDLRDNLWQAGFYRSLMQFEASNISDFRESMQKLTDIQQPEWQAEDAFLSRIWKEEYFLARQEASNH